MTAMLFVPQMSVAVGKSNVQASPHCTVLALAQVMTGAVVSTTVTVWLQRALLPQASLAGRVRVAVNVCPHAALVVVCSMVSVVTPQVSVTVGWSNAHAAPHSTVLAPAQVITGGVVSTNRVIDRKST